MIESYPTRNGIPIPPAELGFDNEHSLIRENHHNAWAARELSRFVLTKTFRNLDSMQFQIPVEPHKKLHMMHAPPELKPSDVYRYVWEAFEREEVLRFGSANKFGYQALKADTMADIDREYRRLI